MRKEFSAGGVVNRGSKVLLVRVCNLQGEKVWTFPKGHLEKGESSLEAALREVEEETGWRCRTLGPLFTVHYRFARKGQPVAKRVEWFRLEPIKKVGPPDEGEILATRWVDESQAVRLLKYPSDLELLERLTKDTSKTAVKHCG
jgi:8-oxo-dGTP diphosphatase